MKSPAIAEDSAFPRRESKALVPSTVAYCLNLLFVTTSKALVTSSDALVPRA